MGKIKILDESVSNIIAAGEVVENPESMIKEMIENSLDANATIIKIEVSNGGLNVKISDNGIGMDKDDTLLCMERHATSKILKKEDVFNLQTYGFRGEALSSIAAVSKLTISTRSKESTTGYKISSYGGVVRNFEEISKNVGTEIEVRDLFYNTPARKKFLRKQATEYAKIKEIVLKEALANTKVSFILEIDGKSSISTSGRGIDNTIFELFGKNVLKNLKKFKYGYLGNVEILRSSKDFIFTYVNKRYVKSATIERAIIDGYYTKLMKGKFPFVIIFFDINPNEIDVNVHPSKKIVKFSNDKLVYKQIKDEIDEFFYYSDRENWQPNVDFLKQNINIESNEVEKEKITNLFGENEKVEEQQYFSFETHDGNFSKKIDVFEDEKIGEKKFGNNSFENRNFENNKFNENSFITKNDVDIIKEDNKVNENLQNYKKENKEKSIEEILFEMENLSNEKRVNGIKFVNNDLEEENFKNKVSNYEISKNENFEEKKIENNYKVGTFEKKVGFQYEYDVLGQIFDTYILVKKDNELEIYDQHIIHERILYEELKEKFYSKKIESQQLLLPQKMEISEIEKAIIFENIEIFNDFGFEIDELENEIVFRAVPVFDFRDTIQNVFLKLLNDLKNEFEIKDLRENIIISMSCKGAVKAGQKLNIDEMRNMVRRLHEVGEYTCPHGRPIIVKLTRNDLDKMFGRKK